MCLSKSQCGRRKWHWRLFQTAGCCKCSSEVTSTVETQHSSCWPLARACPIPVYGWDLSARVRSWIVQTPSTTCDYCSPNKCMYSLNCYQHTKQSRWVTVVFKQHRPVSWDPAVTSCSAWLKFSCKVFVVKDKTDQLKHLYNVQHMPQTTVQRQSIELIQSLNHILLIGTYTTPHKCFNWSILSLTTKTW